MLTNNVYFQSVNEVLSSPLSKKDFVSQKKSFEYSLHPIIALKKGFEKGKSTVLEVTLKHTLSTAYVVSTPEANAITVGRIVTRGGKKIFQLPRFHTGVPAQYDASEAMRQAVQYPPIKKIIEKLVLAESGFLVNLMREGHISDFQSAVFTVFGKTIPATHVHIQHSPDTDPQNKLGRTANLCQPNFEGLNPEKIETLFVSDNVASGIQIVSVIGEVLSFVKKTSKNKKLHVVVICPLLSLFGCRVISKWCEKNNLPVSFIAYGGLLGSVEPEMYYSPLLIDKTFVGNEELAAIHWKAHPKKVFQKACVRCNWTASFLAPNHALYHSQMELSGLGSSNKELLDTSGTIDISKISEEEQSALTPLSTYI